MNTKAKKLISCLAIAAITTLSLTGCSSKKNTSDTSSNNNSDSQVKGRYIESEIKLPFKQDYSAHLEIDSSGTLSLIHSEEKKDTILFTKYTLNENNTWDSTKLAEVPLIDTESYQPYLFTMADGRQYACYNSGSNPNKEHLLKKTENGWDEVKVADWNKLDDESDTYPVPSDIGMLEDGSLVVNLDGEIKLYDPETGKVTKTYDDLDGDSLMNISFKDDLLMAAKLDPVTYSVKSILTYNMKDGTSQELPCPDEISDYSYNITQMNEQIFIVNSNGIQSYQNGTSKWQLIADGSLTSLYLPFLSVMSFAATPENDYYALCLSDDTVKLYKYTFDSTVSAIPDKEIKVYSLNDNSLIRQAVVSFQQSHPDVRVTVDVAMSDENDTASKEDYIRSLNTSLLAGQGDDILVLDGLPYESYQQKGVLADLNDMVQPLIDKGELLSNVVDAFKVDDGYYYIPTKFSPILVLGTGNSAESCTTLKDMIAYAKEHKERPIIGGRTSTAIIDMFLPVYLKSMRKADGSLSEDDLRTFLEELNELFQLTGGVSVLDDSYNPDDMSSYFTTYDIASKITADVTESDGYLMSCFSLAIIKYINGSMSNFEHAFNYNGLLGINKASKNKKLAEEFVAYTLSKEIQSTDLLDGHSVNASVLEDYYDKKMEEAETTIEDASGSFVPFKVGTPDKKLLDQLLTICKTTDTCIYKNDLMTKTIEDHAQELLAGKKSLSETVNAIKSELKLYTQE